VRLQVFLSKAGISSRRSASDFIKSGRISVNEKKVFEPSYKVYPGKDKVSLDGNIVLPLENLYIMLNKPKGVTTTKKDRFAEKTVMDLLPRDLRHVNPAGRLDKDTTGLLLLTNDGELINKLTHPRFNIDKLYEVRIDRHLSDKDRVRIEKGVDIDGKETFPCDISVKDEYLLDIRVHEGRNRQIKRMFAALGYKVIELKRVKEAFLSLGGLREGEWRYLTDQEASRLKKGI
jgi:23S rRNA pseudouridine2605 synthase